MKNKILIIDFMLNKRPSQIELFSGSLEASHPDWNRRQLLLKNLTLSLENIIVLSILLVMVLVLFYAYGVEHGKQKAAVVVATQPKEVVKSSVQVPALKREQVSAKPALQTIQPNQPKAVVPVQNAGGQRVNPSAQLKTVTATNPVPAAFPATHSAAAVKTGFTVQVASYKTVETANRAAENLKSLGQELHVVTKGDYQILCVGRFNTEAEAKKIASKLKKRFKDCLVRRL
jgi:cell division protein FtsN